MPAPLSIDWDHVVNLYNQGLKVPRIAEMLGVKPNTISARAKRHNWAQNRDRAVTAVSEVVKNMVLTRPKTVQERAQKWVEREISAVEDITNKLDDIPIPDTLPKLREHIEVRAMNGKYGRSTFGLDQAGHSITLNVGLMGRGDLIPPTEVIDVQPEPDGSTPGATST